jgi:Ca2+-binding RTX toxin-like protein
MIVEQLERRRLFAITVSQGYPGFYQIDGDAAPDTIAISVSQDDGTFTLNGATYANVEHITVRGFGGDDNIAIDGTPGPIGASIDGGDDNDILSLNFDGAIWGGAGNDQIRLSNAFRGEAYGDDGDDSLIISGDCIDAEIRGGAGNDTIDASANNYPVLIHGDDGDDVLHGSAYDDTLCGDLGSDTAYGQSGNDTFYTTEIAHGDDGNDILHRTSDTNVYDGIEQVLDA